MTGPGATGRLAATSSDGTGWPAIEWEDQLWQQTAREFGTQTERLTGAPQRYRAALPPMIAELTPRLNPETTELAEASTLELSRFDAELGHRVAAFAPVLLRSEAAASSQIEHLTASARQILTAELGAPTGRNATQIAANTRAMQAAIGLSDDVSAESIKRMHAILMEGQPRHTPGEWRDEPVWIGTRNDSPVGAEFVAPVKARIAPLINDATAFARRFDVQPLVSVALSHAQFETIHPFSDGNGRTGRAFAQSLLRHRAVTRNVAVPVSAGLLADIEAYHDALTAYRDGDPAPIVRAFADASWRAVANSRHLVTDIDRVRESWNNRLVARRHSGAWQLLDLLARRPVIDAKVAADELGIQVTNVYPHLNKLADAGIIRRNAEHDFGPVWRAEEVLVAVDEFAARAGRRQAN